ncbi:MAG: hypothetical protein ACOYO0_09995 [Sandarakinorhabdus sp.]
MWQWLKNNLAWLSEFVSGSNRASAAIIEIYRQSLLDNVLQPSNDEPETKARITVLKEELKGAGPLTLGQLYSIEAELWNYYTDATVLARLWSVLDRFDRVVSAHSRNAYAQTVPASTDAQWADANFVRQQALSLIDAIQNTQMVNLERERFTNMLRTSIFAIGLSLSLLLLGLMMWAFYTEAPKLVDYYMILFVLGTLGACVSYVRRLQGAVEHDALAGDGLSELNTIANNRIAALSTLLVGGIFAIVVYWLVLSSAFAALIPAQNSQPGLSVSVLTTESLLAGAKAELATREDQQKAAPDDTGIAAEVAAKRTEVNNLAADIARMKGELASFAPLAAQTKDCPATTGTAAPACKPSFGQRSASVMELADARSFYLMLVLAFLAGFGEQFVPDALDKLSRRMKGQS